MISASLIEEVGGVMTGNDIPSLGPVGGLSGELRKKRLQRAWREQAAQQALFPGCLWPRCGEQGGWGRATLLLGAVGGRGGSQWEPAGVLPGLGAVL